MNPNRSLPQSAAVVAGNTAFALDLYRRLGGEPGNLFFSPYSISAALAMTYAGARSETAAQMAATLHFDRAGDHLHGAFAALHQRFNAVQAQGAIALHTANSLWPLAGYPFLPAFLDLCLACYGVQITPQDYVRDPQGARREINAWVEAQTRGKIKDLLGPLHVTTATTLVLVNAIYFKGNWDQQFDPAETEEAPFWPEPGRQLLVPTMHRAMHAGYGEVDGLQALELRYEGGDLSLIVLLPAEAEGLAGLEARLTPENLAWWTGRLPVEKVRIWLPRFRLRGQFDLGSALAAMGMPAAFGPADFSGMTGGRELFISAVVHQAFVEVNEEGSEAAAATAVLMGRGFVAAPPEFRANRPFLFLIRENRTGSVLFLGRVVEPDGEG